MNKRKIILDTETTGLRTTDGNRVIEIGCLEVINDELTGSQYHCYFNPQREIEEGAFKTHGISYESLKNKPLFSEKVEYFLDYIRDAELIIHNARFDIDFLDNELLLHYKEDKKISDIAQIFCTLEYAKSIRPFKKNTLDALCIDYNIDNSNRTLHGALLDSSILFEVYKAMVLDKKHSEESVCQS